MYDVSVRRGLFDLVCAGVALEAAARVLGVSRRGAQNWWYQAGGMRLVNGQGGGGLVTPGRSDGPGGPGHRLNCRNGSSSCEA